MRPSPRGVLERRLERAAHLAVILDYDGTIVPIVSRPHQARLPGRTRSLLRRLARHPAVSLLLLSGRSLRDLRRLARIPEAAYAGNHGLETQEGRVRIIHGSAGSARERLRRLAGILASRLRPIPGARVEWKGLTLSVHWRLVARAHRARFHETVRVCLAAPAARGAVRLTHGKRVVDVLPPTPWDKGACVAWFLRRTGWGRSPRTLILGLGDDTTDEALFRAVNRRGGVSVLVGGPGRRTAARWRVRGPQAVRRLLAWLLVRCPSD